MQDTQILRTELGQRINKLPLQALQQVGEFITSVEAQFVSFYQGSLAQTKPKKSFSENLLKLQQELWNEIGDEPIPDDELFIENVTWNEYVKLSDDAQGELWNEASDIDLMDLEELEVPSHVLPTR